jgi:pimeloyl-ACP methyl ester carboxylesterase
MALSKKKMALGGCGTVLLVLVCGLAWLHHLVFDRTPGQFFDSNGVKLYYTVEGNEKADPVVLIHGLAAHSDINWRRPGINALLAKDFRVISYDLRGHGLSDRPHDPEQYGLETIEDISRLMDHLGIQKAHLAGYSLGGFIALKYATAHPERVQSIAICASGWKNPEDAEPLRSPYKDDPDARLAPDPKKLNRLLRNSGMAPKFSLAPSDAAPVGFPAETKLASLLPADFDPVKRARDYFGDKVVDREAMRALKKTLVALMVTADELKACKTPALCLMGTRDGLKPYALDLKQAMPACELVLIDGADHVTTVLFGAFQSKLQAFLLSHRAVKP